MDKILFQKDDYIVGMDGDGRIYETYGYIKRKYFLKAAATYIKKLQAEIYKYENTLDMIEEYCELYESKLNIAIPIILNIINKYRSNNGNK